MSARIGIAGFFLEANRFAPPITGAAFAQAFDLAGDALQQQIGAKPSRTLPDIAGFAAAMQDTGAWTPVALRVAAAYPAGPVEQDYFESLMADIEARLRAAMPLDGVFISSHGAALTTGSDDPDGEFFERVRRTVGPAVPVIAVLDLHTNVSQRMSDALSAFVAYRTNPHVDLFARGQEAAGLMRAMLQGGPGEVALVKLPFLPASTDQLIAPGTPFQELVELGEKQLGEDILNVSLCGGFPLSDCAKCGFSVVVTARRGRKAAAEATARAMAGAVWERRHRFLKTLTPLAEAVALAAQPHHPARLILADVADNPGGGGAGNTTALLRALLEAGVQDALLGVFYDPALAAEAHQRGTGARFEACFNRAAGPDPFAQALVQEAVVLALADGDFVGRKGLVKGSAQSMGPSALLDLGGVRVAVISQRQQLLDPAQLDVLGVDMGSVRTLVVKSRGHFRAAFEDFAAPDRIIEVDGPGLTSPNLRQLPLQRVPRPVFPLDPDTVWPA